MLNCIFATYTFSITLGLDTYESTSFKLGMMPDSTKLYMFYTSLKDLDLLFKVTGIQESWNLCSHSVGERHEVASMFPPVDYVRER